MTTSSYYGDRQLREKQLKTHLPVIKDQRKHFTRITSINGMRIRSLSREHVQREASSESFHGLHYRTENTTSRQPNRTAMIVTMQDQSSMTIDGTEATAVSSKTQR